MDIVGGFQSALNLHRQGRLGEAEALCREVLSAEPAHVEALDLLGVLCVESGRFDAAAGFLRRAVALRPEHGRTHAYLGFALRRLGQLHLQAASDEELPAQMLRKLPVRH